MPSYHSITATLVQLAQKDTVNSMSGDLHKHIDSREGLVRWHIRTIYLLNDPPNDPRMRSFQAVYCSTLGTNFSFNSSLNVCLHDRFGDRFQAIYRNQATISKLSLVWWSQHLMFRDRLPKLIVPAKRIVYKVDLKILLLLLSDAINPGRRLS